MEDCGQGRGGFSLLGYGVSKNHLYLYRRSLVLVAYYLLFHGLYTLVKVSKINYSNCSETLKNARSQIMRKFLNETTRQVYKRWDGWVGGRRRETFTKNKRSESASDRAWSTVYEIIQIIRWTLHYPARNVNQYRLLELIVIMLMSPRVRGGEGGSHTLSAERVVAAEWGCDVTTLVVPICAAGVHYSFQEKSQCSRVKQWLSNHGALPAETFSNMSTVSKSEYWNKG